MLLSYGIVPVWRLKYIEKCIEIETMYLFHILSNKLNLQYMESAMILSML